MNKVWLVALMVLFYFGLGFSSGAVLSSYFAPEQLPSSPSSNVLLERPSPYDHIKEDQIKVYDNKVEISLGNNQISWARFANSNSMDPILDETANSIEIIPETKDDIHVGDIVAFSYGTSLIVHRIIEIGYDEQGWYAITAGDNSDKQDSGKRRFSDIKYVTVGILY